MWVCASVCVCAVTIETRQRGLHLIRLPCPTLHSLSVRQPPAHDYDHDHADNTPHARHRQRHSTAGCPNLCLCCPSSSIMRHATKCNRCSDPYHVPPLSLPSLRAHLIVYVEQINLLNCISQPSCNCHAHSATMPLSPPQPRLRSAQLANTFFLLISKFG